MFLLDNAQPFYINAATAATHTLVAAVTGKRIYVWRLFLVAGGTVNVNFEDGTTDLGGVLPLVAQSQVHLTLSDQPMPWFITTESAAFGMTLSGAIQVSGYGLYSTS